MRTLSRALLFLAAIFGLFGVALGKPRKSQFNPKTQLSLSADEYNITYEGPSPNQFSAKWISSRSSLIITLACGYCSLDSSKSQDSSSENDTPISLNISCSSDDPIHQFNKSITHWKNSNRSSSKKSTISGSIKCEVKSEASNLEMSCSDSSITIAAIISFLAIIISALALVIYAVNYRQNEQEAQLRGFFSPEKEKLINRSSLRLTSNYTPERLTIVKTVIEGDYGSCLIGKFEHDGESRRVFVKKLREVSNREEMMTRAKIFERLKPCDLILSVNMTSFQERNFQAMYFQNVEGPLKWFLKRCQLRTNPSHRSTVSTVKLKRFTYQAAEALAYLSSNDIIHGDVASRNFVLDEYNENILLGDTVISLELFPADYFEGRPIRWQAPECIDTPNHASLSGDVWAYGIFVWELFSLAQAPYKDIDCLNISQYLSEGYRLVQPDGFPESLWNLIGNSCWQYSSSKRKNIHQILQELQRLQICSSSSPNLASNQHTH